MIAVYETALESGDPSSEVDRYSVGQKIGLHPRGINTICNTLAQANFIKKAGPENIYLTDHGISFIKEN